MLSRCAISNSPAIQGVLARDRLCELRDGRGGTVSDHQNFDVMDALRLDAGDRAAKSGMAVVRWVITLAYAGTKNSVLNESESRRGRPLSASSRVELYAADSCF